jgi:Flp pilus assembly secretin CpaC
MRLLTVTYVIEVTELLAIMPHFAPNRSFLQAAVASVLLVASSAFGSAFSVEVGQTKVMGVSQRIVGITVSDPSVVEVQKLRNGGGVTLLGKEKGKTEIALRTVDGNEVEFMLYVTSEGAKVFTTSRDAETTPAKKATLMKRKARISPETKPAPVETEKDATEKQVAESEVPQA